MISGGSEVTIRISSFLIGKTIRIVNSNEELTVITSLAFIKDWNLFVSGNSYDLIQIWNM